jgi:hypothetical protein
MVSTSNNNLIHALIIVQQYANKYVKIGQHDYTFIQL